MPDSTQSASGAETLSTGIAPPSPLKCAVVQFAPDKQRGSTASNLQRIRDYIQRGKDIGVQLMVFPELGTSGYNIDEDSVDDATHSAELVLDEMKREAKDAQMRLIVSYPSYSEQTGKRHITASSFSRWGNVELTYHKTHPWAASTFENAFFTLGSHFCDPILLEEHADAWLNVLICWDIEFPEPARVLRLRTPGEHHYSALVLCIPTANADASIHEYTLRTRACENHCFILYANTAGDAFSGGSSIVAPDGTVLAMADGTKEQMVVAELDLSRARYETVQKVNPMLEWRRPELYGAIGEQERWDKPGADEQ